MSEYLTNLKGFKNLIESYTIADLRSLIYGIENKPSGGCCYPAVQTLFSLMELVGKLLTHNDTNGKAFISTFIKLSERYNNENLASKLYECFRHGIAHTSLAKGGVQVKKSGDASFHLSDKGNNIDIKILFEDFVPVFHDIFDNQLQQEKYISEYETRLKGVFKELKIDWCGDLEIWGGLESSADYSRTDVTTPSGTQSSKIFNSGASTTTVRSDELFGIDDGVIK